MNLAPVQAYVAYLIGYWDAANVIEWAAAATADDPTRWECPDFAELATLNPGRVQDDDKVRACLTGLVEMSTPVFQVSDEEPFAKQLFRVRLEEYLTGTCTPYQVCGMVSAIEDMFDYPDWLGDMYNACDWIEADSKPVDCRHLEAEVTNTLNRMIA